MPYFHGHKKKGNRPEATTFQAVLWAVGRVLREPHPAVRGHKRLYASSLAFKTLLALIPALALVMSVLANDAFSQKREQILDQIVDAIYPVQTQPDNSFLDPSEPKNLQELNEIGKQEIRLSVRKFAGHAQKVGLIGFAGFIVVVFFLLRDVEDSFNFLWGVERARPVLAQMVRHAVFFVFLPLLVVLLMVLKEWAAGWHFWNPRVHYWLFIKVLPFSALWFACSWMYLWIPNARVDKKVAFLTGLLVAFLLETARWGVNWYAVKVLAQSHIYGALWMFPIILIWFYVSWTVTLFGAEAAFFAQKHRAQRTA